MSFKDYGFIPYRYFLSSFLVKSLNVYGHRGIYPYASQLSSSVGIYYNNPIIHVFGRPLTHTGYRGYTDFLGGGAKRARVGIRLRLYELISITAWSDWGMLIDNKVDGLY
jgi:hypothetical protein